MRRWRTISRHPPILADNFFLGHSLEIKWARQHESNHGLFGGVAAWPFAAREADCDPGDWISPPSPADGYRERAVPQLLRSAQLI